MDFKKIDNEQINNQRAFQADILKRFLKDKEWEEFKREYWESKRMFGGIKSRLKYLEQPLTEDEKGYLEFYITDTDISVSSQARELNIRPSQLMNRAQKAALKVLYKNQSKLKELFANSK